MTKTKKKKTELEAGDLIEHTTQDFGQGRIMEIKNGIATIAFKKAGKKRFPVGSRYLELAEPVVSVAKESDEQTEQTPEESKDSPSS